MSEFSEIVLWALVFPSAVLSLDFLDKRKSKSIKKASSLAAIVILISGIGLEFDANNHFLSWLTFPFLSVALYFKWNNPIVVLSGIGAYAWLHEALWFFLGLLPSSLPKLNPIAMIFYATISASVISVFYILYNPRRLFVPMAIISGWILFWLANGFPLTPTNFIFPITRADFFAITSWWVAFLGFLAIKK